MDTTTSNTDKGKTEEDSRPSKWQKPQHKGEGGGGKGRSQTSSKGWKSQQWGNWKDDSNQELKNLVSMLTNLVIRQEDQLNINRQDTAFVLFVRTDVQGSLAVSTFNIAKQWKQTKESNLEALKMPMRATLHCSRTLC